MTRTVITVAIISLLVMTIGCMPSDRGLAQRLPQRTTYANPADGASAAVGSADEMDLVEQVSTFRRDYRHSLELLTQHYTVVGENKKLGWANEELRALDRMPQYRYIVDAEVLPASLTATERILAADELYLDAKETQRQADPIGVFTNQEQLRVAREKYTQLIRQYPTSDKIDDAAYQVADIYEKFKNYEIALLYYQRAYQWDPETPNPARFHAAVLLDKRLHRRDEALELYQEAVLREGGQFGEWKMYGEKRIKELSSSDDGRM
jgi:tetratricopeptide (TPR) repeat protein